MNLIEPDSTYHGKPILDTICFTLQLTAAQAYWQLLFWLGSTFSVSCQCKASCTHSWWANSVNKNMQVTWRLKCHQYLTYPHLKLWYFNPFSVWGLAFQRSASMWLLLQVSLVWSFLHYLRGLRFFFFFFSNSLTKPSSQTGMCYQCYNQSLCELHSLSCGLSCT